MRLYSYQKELLNCKAEKVLINWARSAGKDSALSIYILENKPENVFLHGVKWDFNDLLDCLKVNGKEYNATLEKSNMEDYKLIFEATGKTVNLTLSHEKSGRKKFNLAISYTDYDLLSDELYDKYIVALTRNSHSLNKKFDDFYKINVDYRKMLEENIISLDTVISSARKSKYFYREYAILDKPEKEEMNFSEFQDKALQKLQKQFLDTPDSKDTVLTRKAIIEMIKDLKQLNN